MNPYTCSCTGICTICKKEVPASELSSKNFIVANFEEVEKQYSFLLDKSLRFQVCKQCQKSAEEALALRYIAAAIETSSPFICGDGNLGWGIESLEEIPEEERKFYTPEFLSELKKIIEEGKNA